MNVIGISAHYHEAACCLLVDGQLIAMAPEERFSRRKHDASLPLSAFWYCLEEAGFGITDIDCVAYYEKPEKKLARQLTCGVPKNTWHRAEWLDVARPEREIREVLGFEGEIQTFDHHLSHAASAFFFSGFTRAATWTIDGVGEWTTTSYGLGEAQRLQLIEEVSFPHSLGLLYASVTSYLGFAVNSDEYKVMGLAPYGRPTLVDALRSLCSVEPGAGFRLALEYFDFSSARRSYTKAFVELLGQPARKPEAEITQFHKDVACSLQCVLEEVILQKAQHLAQLTGARHLCMAGGVALNAVAIGALRRARVFDDLFVQPAAGDAGACLGAASLAEVSRDPTRVFAPLQHTGYGPGYDEGEIHRGLQGLGIRFEDFRGAETELLTWVAQRIASGKVVGWFHGRMEFGPRALGARSILADPRDPSMRQRLNALVKKREAFRPFAPSVLLEHARDTFVIDGPLPFMTEVCPVRADAALPAVTHVDDSARPQTVDRRVLPRFAALLDAFAQLTGEAVLVNTSFNIRGEPIVCSPRDALLSFARSGIDLLVLESFVIEREALTAPLCRALEVAAAAQDRASGIRHEVYTLV